MQKDLEHSPSQWRPRLSQIEPPGKWLVWAIVAGRGFGKTRTGAQTIKNWSKIFKEIGIVGYSALETRKIMIEGPSGLIEAFYNDGINVKYEPSKRLLTVSNGCRIHAFSADNPDQFRGFELGAVWIDEFAKFNDPDNLWKQVTMVLRNSENPKIICTTTPRPIKILMDMISDKKNVVVTTGSSFDNKENLSEFFLSNIVELYSGTDFEKQEIYGEIIGSDSFIFTQEMIDNAKRNNSVPYKFSRIILGVDPAVTSNENSDESGMILVGLYNGIFYVLEDMSGKYSPILWAKKISETYKSYKCDVVLETNNGGDFLSNAIRVINNEINIINKRAYGSKIERSYRISILYSQGRIKHVSDFPKLENQLLYPNEYKSPDRMDALIMAICGFEEVRSRISIV